MSRYVSCLKLVVVVVFAFVASSIFCATQTFAADPSGSKGNPIWITSNTGNTSASDLLRTALSDRNGKCRIYVKKSDDSSVDFDIVKDDIKEIAFKYVVGYAYAKYGDYITYHAPLVKSKVGIDDNVYYLQYNILYLDNTAQEVEATSNVSSILSSLSLSGKTQWQKIRDIRNYFLNNVNLDFSYQNDSGGLAYSSSMANPRLVSLLFYRLLLSTNIQARVINGYYINSHGEQIDHSWIIVKVGSYWYNIDTALDMFISKYDGGFTEYDHEESCFLYSNQNFQNHVRDPEYNTEAFNSTYPMTSKSYDPGSTKNPYGCDNHPYRTLGRF